MAKDLQVESRVNEIYDNNNLAGCPGNSWLQNARVCLLMEVIIKWLCISDTILPVDQHMMLAYPLINMLLFPVSYNNFTFDRKVPRKLKSAKGTPCWQHSSTPRNEDYLYNWYLPQSGGPKYVLEDPYLI